METEIGWGKTSLRWLSHWLLQRKKKGVGIRTIVNLPIRGAFYYTFRVNLRASAVSGCRTDPPELGLAGKTCAESVTVLRTPLDSPCAQMSCGTPSAVPH